MSIGIMQPYFFPYIGYFQLIKAVDTFVIADDLNYIKNGFINKNSILMNNEAFKISLSLKGSSQNRLINEIEIGNNQCRLIETIRRTYKKAPFFSDVFPLIEGIIMDKENNLALYLGNSLKNIAEYLRLPTKFVYSSEIEKDNTLKFTERIVDICHRLGENHYINATGGQELYKKDLFFKNNIYLDFVQTHSIEYQQYNNKFIPNLSIIDVLMFNDSSDINNILKSYELV